MNLLIYYNRHKILIYFIRHGESVGNIQGTIQGSIDLPLTETGIYQSQLLSNYLNVKNLDFFYSSPLLRAKQTAEIINQKFNLEIKFTNNLREYNYGIAEGKNWMVATNKFGIQLGAWGFGNIKGEEGPIEFCERVDTFVGNLLDDCINKNVVCVSHGAVINRVASFILGFDVENRPRIKINNTSVMAVDNSKNKPTIVTINDCMHLL